MNRAEAEKRIAAVTWYHEFDFGDGLRTPMTDPDVAGHRLIWDWFRQRLDGIDFRGKSVLDVGCWDGYWSFEAERRGAKSVLATDDMTQNWGDGTGIYLARELLRSNIDIDLKQSVYHLERLNRKFDVIIFFGVYYHLHDPFLALAQLRHCCHPDTVMIIGGPVTYAIPDGTANYDFDDHRCEWLPTLGALRMVVRANYFDIRHEIQTAPPDAHIVRPADSLLGWRYRLKLCVDALRGRRKGILDRTASITPHHPPPKDAQSLVALTVAPVSTPCSLHVVPPPFGLAKYDPRFADAAAK